MPRDEQPAPTGELRFDVLTRTWVNIAAHRQHRPNLPTDDCPFCVGGLEAPDPYSVRWFENRWPPMSPGPAIDLHDSEAHGQNVVPARGAAEVVLFTPEHEASLGTLPVEQVRAIVDLWAERTDALLQRDEVEYVLVFENRGTEVGATIHHPHGQIYGYPFVPSVPADEAKIAREYGCGVCAELKLERDAGVRVVAEAPGFTAWVPFASGQPYGMRVAPHEHIGRINDLDDAGRDALATIVRDAVGRYDLLWRGKNCASSKFPYLMWFHQAPRHHDGEYHLHVHFAPPQRAPGVMRFVASGELGGGLLANPVAPEAAAAELRDAVERP